MGDFRLALQVLLVLLLVLAGTPDGALAAPLEWTASSDPNEASAMNMMMKDLVSKLAKVETWT